MSEVLGFPTLITDQEEAKLNARRTCIFLSRFSKLMSSRRFHAYVANNRSRFEWASERICDRLRHELFLQIGQGCSIRASENAPHSQQLWLTSVACEAEIERLCKAHNLTLSKKDTTFVIPRSDSYEDEIYKLSQLRPTPPRIHDSGRPFYLWNSIDALITFIEARHTLTTDTGHEKLERWLHNLDEDYLLSGFPHDVLVHDVKTVTNRPDKIIGIIMRKDYCSTWTMVDRNDPRLEDPSYRFVDLARA